MPEDLNVTRKMRATSDRGILLGPFRFERVISAEPEVLVGFHRPDETSVDDEVIKRFDETILVLLEPLTTNVETGSKVPTEEAWTHMRRVGDENGKISFMDMGELIKILLGGVVERPTDEPSDSQDGSKTLSGGTSSTVLSPSEAVMSPPSTPGGS